MSIEPIALRQEIVGDETRVYAVMDWPEQTSIAVELLTGSDMIVENENGEIIIAVANGTAIYRRAKEQPDLNYVICELCNSSWSPAPLLEAVQTPEAKAGRERLRELFKDRS